MNVFRTIISTVFIALLLSSCGGGANLQSPSLTITDKSVSGSSLVYTYSDGSTVSKVIATTATATWASDHITKTTAYTLSDGSADSITETVSATINKVYSASAQTVTTAYGDGYSTTVNNTAVSNSISWAADHTTKTTTYTFADSETNPVVTIVNPSSATTYSGNTQTITSTYGDGHTSSTSNTAVSSAITWAEDHVTKTTTYTFADSETNSVVTAVNPSSATTYSGNTQTVTTTYGDGYSSAVNNSAATSVYSAGTDDIVYTHTFADTSINAESIPFSWTNYTAYLNSSEYDFSGELFLRAYSLIDYERFWVEASSVSSPSAYTGNDLTHLEYLNSSGIAGRHDYTTAQGGGDINIFNNSLIFKSSSSSSVLTSFETVVDKATFSATSYALNINPFRAQYEYMTFGTWTTQANLFDGMAWRNGEMTSAQFTGISTPFSNLNGSYNHTFTGQVIGIDTQTHGTPKTVYSDLSMTVNSVGAMSFVGSNSKVDGAVDNKWDFTGIGNYAAQTASGGNVFNGRVDFINHPYSNAGSGLKGVLRGGFFGPNAEEVAGYIFETGGDYSSSTSANYYTASFGAAR